MNTNELVTAFFFLNLTVERKPYDISLTKQMQTNIKTKEHYNMVCINLSTVEERKGFIV
jgi:hypothetical protein